MPKKIDPALRERAVRLVLDYLQEYPPSPLRVRPRRGPAVSAPSRCAAGCAWPRSTWRPSGRHVNVTEGFAVESICRALRELRLQIAARTDRWWKQASRPVPDRTITDAQVVDRVRDLV